MELKLFYTVVVAIFGMLFGSFYNVVGWRIPQGLSIVKPGSFCPKCKHKLRWYELIPVFSFLIQGFLQYFKILFHDGQITDLVQICCAG